MIHIHYNIYYQRNCLPPVFTAVSPKHRCCQSPLHLHTRVGSSHAQDAGESSHALEKLPHAGAFTTTQLHSTSENTSWELLRASAPRVVSSRSATSTTSGVIIFSRISCATRSPTFTATPRFAALNSLSTDLCLNMCAERSKLMGGGLTCHESPPLSG